MVKKLMWFLVLIILIHLVVGCASLSPPAATPTVPQPQRQLADKEYYWEQRLQRDDIRPIYEPTFVAASEANYQDDELVIGVALNGEAKAYPIGPLNGREMVNDTLGGIPILVTW